tara:strand:- start:65 stop:382 length:318 start_codon:yes stop_codon:yes gene_type:complete
MTTILISPSFKHKRKHKHTFIRQQRVAKYPTEFDDDSLCSQEEMTLGVLEETDTEAPILSETSRQEALKALASGKRGDNGKGGRTSAMMKKRSPAGEYESMSIIR